MNPEDGSLVPSALFSNGRFLGLSILQGGWACHVLTNSFLFSVSETIGNAWGEERQAKGLWGREEWWQCARSFCGRIGSAPPWAHSHALKPRATSPELSLQQPLRPKVHTAAQPPMNWFLGRLVDEILDNPVSSARNSVHLKSEHVLRSAPDT